MPCCYYSDRLLVPLIALVGLGPKKIKLVPNNPINSDPAKHHAGLVIGALAGECYEKNNPNNLPDANPLIIANL
jgi:hypothetical protein